jgi:gamma-glutamyltranspeptidase/glutathione hydrolase
MGILQAGGTAVDAAIATAAALTVLQPTSNGIGSDAFAMVWDGSQLYGLNASGRAPALLTRTRIVAEGHAQVPLEGWLGVTVPGAVSGWVALHERFGKMPFTDLLRPAIEYAERGAPVQPITARLWADEANRLGHLKEFTRVFLPDGRAPRPGEVIRLPDHARTLSLIAESYGRAFYRGELAQAIADYSEESGGVIRHEDLAAHHPDWVEPMHIGYRGYDIWELPPNGQGIVALIALGILEGFDLSPVPHASPEYVHLVTEALKLAFADGYAVVADPSHVPTPPETLLDPSSLAKRRGLIRRFETLRDRPPTLVSHGDTVYLCVSDADGRMVSFIQSNYTGFGSGVVVPGTGITLQNRAACFTMAEGHPNTLEPGKRPYHTIIPGFVTQGSNALCAFGVVGGDMQPQGHVQFATAVLDYGLNPQSAFDAPRFKLTKQSGLALELPADRDVLQQLREWGHDVIVDVQIGTFGGGQAIWRDPKSGAYVAATEPRYDGTAIGM